MTEEMKNNTGLVREDDFEYPLYSEQDANRDGGYKKAVSIPAGKSEWRFLPKPTIDGVVKESVFKKSVKHWIRSTLWEKAYVVACINSMPELAPEGTPKGSCPACAIWNQMKAEIAHIESIPVRSRTNEQHYRLQVLKDEDTGVNVFRPQTRFYANAINLTNPDQVVLLDMPKWVHDDLRKLRTTPKNEGGGDWSDPKDGYDVSIKKEGTKYETTYTVSLIKNPRSVNNKVVDSRQITNIKQVYFQQIDLDMVFFIPDMEDANSKVDEAYAEITALLNNVPPAPPAPPVQRTLEAPSRVPPAQLPNTTVAPAPTAVAAPRTLPQGRATRKVKEQKTIEQAIYPDDTPTGPNQ